MSEKEGLKERPGQNISQHQDPMYQKVLEHIDWLKGEEKAERIKGLEAAAERNRQERERIALEKEMEEERIRKENERQMEKK